ncbi:NAD(P)/FAD-dependent oxidoreductase [Streptosporangium algeriense]|uniref:NAD(P)/FAD-dependent oxidoreductase n=1 Tax=Streptosporangium algeriense TaxID=1682748 RepID=A0ABW3DHG4_9ACTN
MTADIAIVGAGVIGCLTAYEVGRRHPDWDIVVLERHAVGSGATAWSAGARFPMAATPEHRRLATESDDVFAELAETPAGDFIRPVPMVYVTERDHLDDLRARMLLPLREVSPAERDCVEKILVDMVVRPGEILVTHDAPGFVVSARPLAEAVLTLCVARGRTELHIGQTVTRIDRNDAGLYRLDTEEGSWHAKRVVLATGPWALPEIGRSQPHDFPVKGRTKRVAALHTRLPVASNDPMVYFTEDDLFVLPTSRGAALVSFFRDEWDSNPEELDGRPDSLDLTLGTEVLASRSQTAADHVIGGRTFCDLYLPQRLPAVMESPGSPGVVAVLGGSGSGVRLGPALAAQAVRQVAAHG